MEGEADTTVEDMMRAGLESMKSLAKYQATRGMTVLVFFACIWFLSAIARALVSNNSDS